MGDEESNEIEEIHEQLTHDTTEVTVNNNDLVRLQVDDDNAFFEVEVDVTKLGVDEDEDEDEEWNNIF